MKFGTKKAEIIEPSRYLRNFKKGETKVRFLQEVSEWTGFREHYIKIEGQTRSFPCTGDRERCPGCSSEDPEVQNAPRKYGTYLKLIESDRVLPFRIPARLADRMESRALRNEGTITNRDYTIYREGTGFNTEYDVEQAGAYELNIEALIKDTDPIEDILANSFTDLWGETEQFEQDKPVKVRPLAERTEDPWTEKVKEQPEEFPSKPRSRKKKGAEEDVEYDEITIRKMTKDELLRLYDVANLEVPPNADTDALAEHLINTLA